MYNKVIVHFVLIVLLIHHAEMRKVAFSKLTLIKLV
jgi:hypothetical protein